MNYVDEAEDDPGDWVTSNRRRSCISTTSPLRCHPPPAAHPHWIAVLVAVVVVAVVALVAVVAAVALVAAVAVVVAVAAVSFSISSFPISSPSPSVSVLNSINQIQIIIPIQLKSIHQQIKKQK